LGQGHAGRDEKKRDEVKNHKGRCSIGLPGNRRESERKIENIKRPRRHEESIDAVFGAEKQLGEVYLCSERKRKGGERESGSAHLHDPLERYDMGGRRTTDATNVRSQEKEGGTAFKHEVNLKIKKIGSERRHRPESRGIGSGSTICHDRT